MLIKWPLKPYRGRHWFFKYIGGPLFALFTVVALALPLIGLGAFVYEMAGAPFGHIVARDYSPTQCPAQAPDCRE